MERKRNLVLATVLVALSSLLACTSGVSQEEYDGLAGQLADARSQLEESRRKLVDTETQLQTLTTQMEEASQQSEESLGQARSLAGQRGSSNRRASAYLEVALAVFNFGGESEESVIDEVAKVSSPLSKLGVEDAVYEDLTTRLLRSTDPREIQQLWTAWLFYTFEAASEALKE